MYKTASASASVAHSLMMRGRIVSAGPGVDVLAETSAWRTPKVDRRSLNVPADATPDAARFSVFSALPALPAASHRNPAVLANQREKSLSLT